MSAHVMEQHRYFPHQLQMLNKDFKVLLIEKLNSHWDKKEKMSTRLNLLLILLASFSLLACIQTNQPLYLVILIPLFAFITVFIIQIKVFRTIHEMSISDEGLTFTVISRLLHSSEIIPYDIITHFTAVRRITRFRGRRKTRIRILLKLEDIPEEVIIHMLNVEDLQKIYSTVKKICQNKDIEFTYSDDKF